MSKLKLPTLAVPAARSEAEVTPRYRVGDAVQATVNHMPGMAGMSGTVRIVRTYPAYYGVQFEGETEIHKWLAEDELIPEPE